MSILTQYIAWLPLGAVILHLIEEFAWPGAFPDWFRRYRPERASSVTTGFLVRINALLVVMAIAPILLGSRPYGVALWLTVTSVTAANGAFHLWATYRMKEYSPGLVTGLLVYVPLALFGFDHFARNGLASQSTLVQTALIGPLYVAFSAWNHTRRAAAAGVT